MAGHGEIKHGEMKVDTGSYDKMIGMLKWGALGCAIVVALVIWLIAA